MRLCYVLALALKNADWSHLKKSLNRMLLLKKPCRKIPLKLRLRRIVCRRKITLIIVPSVTESFWIAQLKKGVCFFFRL